MFASEIVAGFCAGATPMTLAVLLAMTISPTPASALPLARAFADPQVAVVATARRPSLLEILDAIRTVDVGAREHGDDTLGEFRIDRAYWRKADLKGKFEDCRDVRYARCVVVAYWQKHYPAALARCDAEVLARIHNGGPNGARNVSTRAYWQKVQRALGARSSRVHSRRVKTKAPNVRDSLRDIEAMHAPLERERREFRRVQRIRSSPRHGTEREDCFPNWRSNARN